MIEEMERDAMLKVIKAYESEFLRLISEKTGLMVRMHQTAEILRTINEACTKFGYEPLEYLQALRTSPPHSALLDHLIAGVTVGETYFFRDKRQMGVLNNLILPELITQKRNKGNLSLRIWSAACSSGDEIYTIAMMLRDKLPDIDRWNLDLLGTDINKIALHKASTGLYNQWAMRSIDDYYKKRYFIEGENKTYQLIPEVRRLAKFNYLNLHEDIYPAILNGTKGQDLILCRNVMIYFDAERISQVMKRLSTCLVHGGYFLLGASDPVNLVGTGFKFCHEQGAIFFQKD